MRIYFAFLVWTEFPGNLIALIDKSSIFELENQHFATPNEMVSKGSQNH